MAVESKGLFASMCVFMRSGVGSEGFRSASPTALRLNSCEIRSRAEGSVTDRGRRRWREIARRGVDRLTSLPDDKSGEN